jgi:hypothetical protein
MRFWVQQKVRFTPEILIARLATVRDTSYLVRKLACEFLFVFWQPIADQHQVYLFLSNDLSGSDQSDPARLLLRDLVCEYNQPALVRRLRQEFIGTTIDGLAKLSRHVFSGLELVRQHLIFELLKILFLFD